MTASVTSALTANGLEFFSDANATTTTCKIIATANNMTMSGTSGAAITMGGFADPINASDVATKNYVDDRVNGLNAKALVKFASIANLDITNGTNCSAGQTIDGVSLVAGDRFLAKDQTTATENGLWVVQAAGNAPTRPDDFKYDANDSTLSNASSVYVWVDQGTVNGDFSYICTTNNGSAVIDSDSLTFVSYNHQAVTTDGTLSRTGNQLSAPLFSGASAGSVVNSKAVIYGAAGQVNATTLQIAGASITSTAAELNILDGLTATTAELNIMDGVTASTAELNIMDGVTATTAELNIMDGVTSTAVELNLVDGSSAGTVANSRAVIYGAAGEVNATILQIGGTSVTSTAAELNILDGVTATALEINILDGVTSTATELNLVDGSTAGSVTNSKAVIYGASGEVNATTLQLGGTSITSTAAELNILDGVTATALEINILDGVTSTATELNLVDGSTAGSVTNSKAVIYGASGEVNATTLQIGGTSITATAAELNIMDGVTATANEINILDGVTSTAAELNLVDGSVAGTIKNSKTVVYGAAGEVNATTLQIGGTAISASPAEINIMDGVTATTSELNVLDGITSSTAELNILDGVTATATELNILDGVTATTAELNILDGVTATAAELNIMDGVTATTAELNIMDGVTSTAAELNLVDGSVAGTVKNSKAVVYGAAGEVNATTLQIAGTSIAASAAELNTMDGITATTAELNIMDGVTCTAAEINLLDGSTAGTVASSKAVVYGSSGEVNATTLQIGGTSISATAAELNIMDGITATTAELNVMDGVTSTAAEINYLDGSTAGTVVPSKAVVYGTSGEVNATTLQIGNTSITSTAAELNLLDGSTASTVVNNRGVIYGAAGEVNATTLQIAGTSITSTASELNLVDGSSAGTVANSRAVIYGAAGEVNATTLQIGGSSISATAAELNTLDGITATTAELNIMDGVTATTAELNIMDGVTATTAELNIMDGVTSTAAELNFVDGSAAGIVSNSKAVVYSASGHVVATQFSTSSDRRLKENILAIPDGLGIVEQLRGVSYDWIGDGRHDTGFIAQEVNAIIPQATGSRGDGYMTVDYSKVVPFLVEAVKKLSERVTMLEGQSS